MDIQPLVQPYGDSVGDRLISELEGGRWSEFRAAVGFAKMSGVEYLDGPLRRFVADGGRAVISIGVDHGGTSFEALSQLLGALIPPNELFIAKHVGQPPSTFHPKAFVFVRTDDGHPVEALVIAGSTNLTEGGLFRNHELSLLWVPDLSVKREAEALQELLSALESWTDVTDGLATKLDVNALVEFQDRGWLPFEKQIAERKAAERTAPGVPPEKGGGLPPGTLKKQRAIPKPAHSRVVGAPAVVLPAPPGKVGKRPSRRRSRRATARGAHQAFFIDITVPSDKTEVYLSKTALGEDPAFFGHPFTGLTTPKKATSVPQPERDPRPLVDIRLLDKDGSSMSEFRGHSLKIWQYDKGPSANQDVRITIPAELLRSLPKGCILEMRKQDGRSTIEYRLDFLTPGSGAWKAARQAAITPLPGGKRKYGWA